MTEFQKEQCLAAAVVVFAAVLLACTVNAVSEQKKINDLVLKRKCGVTADAMPAVCGRFERGDGE